MLEQMKRTYSSVQAVLGGVSRVIWPWYLVAVAGQVATGHYEYGAVGVARITPFTYAVVLVHTVAILLAWNVMHRYLIAGGAADAIQQFRTALAFALAQIRNLIVLMLISLIVIIPLAFLFMDEALSMSPEDAERFNMQLSLTSLPVIVLFFARLLLVAPLAARNEEQPVRRSWRATRGHFIRINILQIGCLLPLVAVSLLADGLGQLSDGWPVIVVSALLTSAGALYSLMLYTQLAEDEYKRLMLT